MKDIRINDAHLSQEAKSTVLSVERLSECILYVAKEKDYTAVLQLLQSLTSKELSLTKL